MQILQRLDSRTGSANNTVLIPLSSLPAGKRCRAIHLDVQVSYTKDAADTLAGDLMPLWLSTLRLANYVNVTGFALHRLVQRIMGRDAAVGTAIPGSGTSGTARFQLVIPFRDPRQTGSDDGSMPCELLRAESLAITFAAGNVHASGNLTVAASGFTVNASAEVVEESHIPQINQIGFFDPGGQTFEVPAGAYKDLFILDGSGTSTITEAEISQVYLEADGNVHLPNMSHGQLVQHFNHGAVKDTAAELTINAAREIPMVWVDQSGKGHITKQPAFEGRARVQVSGTMTAPRVVYWRAILKDSGMVNDIAGAIGTPAGAGHYEPQTATKTPPRALEMSKQTGRVGRKARLLTQVLPGKLRTDPTPSNA